MTEAELKRAYYIRSEIRIYDDKLKALRQMSLIGGGGMSGMPRGGDQGDRTSGSAIKVADLERRIEKLRRRLVKVQAEIMDYISTVDDSFIRQILFMRCIECMSWDGVAAKIGGGNTANGCRMAMRRFLDKGL